MASFVLSGFNTTGSSLWIKMFAYPGGMFSYRCNATSVVTELDDEGYPGSTSAADMLLAPNVPVVCSKQVDALVLALCFGSAMKSLAILPALVLIDRYGPRKIAAIGGFLNVLGFALLMSGIVFQGLIRGEHLLWSSCFLAFTLAESGAGLVFAGVHGFVWHLDGLRRYAFVFVAIMFNMQGWMPVLVQSLLDVVAGLGSATGAQLYGALLVWPILLLLAFTAIGVLTPPLLEYREAAEEVRSMPLPDWNYHKGMIRQIREVYRFARDVLKMRKKSNRMFTATVVTTTTWVTLYNCYAPLSFYDLSSPDFAQSFTPESLKTDMLTSEKFCRSLTWAMMLSGAVVMIGGPALAEQLGIRWSMASVTLVQVLAAVRIESNDYTNRLFVGCCAGICLSGSWVLIGKHMIHYSPPKALASVTCLLSFHVAAMSWVLIFICVQLGSVFGLPTMFKLLTIISSLLGAAYTLICFRQDEPTTSVLGPGEETKLCKNYGCKSINEVLYITGLDRDDGKAPSAAPSSDVKESKPWEVSNTDVLKRVMKTWSQHTGRIVRLRKMHTSSKRSALTWAQIQREVLQNLLASSEPAVQTAIVLRIRPHLFQETLMALPNEDILAMVKTGFIWERGSMATLTASTGGFAILPQLWSQFWKKSDDLSMLSTSEDDNHRGKNKSVHGPGSEWSSEWKEDLLRSLNARVHTKELAKILRRGDRSTLQKWFLTEEINSIKEACWDMLRWDKSLEKAGKDPGEFLSGMFSLMMPLGELVTLLPQRPNLKEVVVEFMKQDLIKAQSEIAEGNSLQAPESGGVSV